MSGDLTWWLEVATWTLATSTVIWAYFRHGGHASEDASAKRETLVASGDDRSVAVVSTRTWTRLSSTRHWLLIVIVILLLATPSGAPDESTADVVWRLVFFIGGLVAGRVQFGQRS